MQPRTDDLLEVASVDEAVWRAVDDATESVLERLGGAELAELGRHNTALLTFDWKGYLRASRHRIAFLVSALRRLGRAGGRVLDQGSYFGNFSLALHHLGYEVTAADYYDLARGALDPWRSLLEEQGVRVRDCGEMTEPLPFADEGFDIGISMGVIEHIPSSPRRHLLDIVRCLRRGGLLALETPNLAYQPKRDLLAEGKSVYQAIEHQFESEYPFSGHHREFTTEEVEWMLTRVGLDVQLTDHLDYSYHSLAYLDDATRAEIRERQQDPTRMELILCCASRSARTENEAR